VQAIARARVAPARGQERTPGSLEELVLGESEELGGALVGEHEALRVFDHDRGIGQRLEKFTEELP